MNSIKYDIIQWFKLSEKNIYDINQIVFSIFEKGSF